MNNILLFIGIILAFSTLLIVKKFFGATGIIGYMGIATILANIMICKSVTIFGMNATLGNVMFACNFLATDILTECYGIQKAKQGISFAIVSLVGFLITTQIILLFVPNEIDIAHTSFQTLFTLTPRITLASLSLFILSNFADIKLYNFLRIKTQGKYMWLRNNISTIVCNGCENFLFYIIAFINIFSLQDLLFMSLTATIIEIIVALCDTPFLYLATKIQDKI